ncbi:MAG: hypothetical protein NVS4B11_22910 [Ktedonobacteraceae bacterium]
MTGQVLSCPHSTFEELGLVNLSIQAIYKQNALCYTSDKEFEDGKKCMQDAQNVTYNGGIVVLLQQMDFYGLENPAQITFAVVSHGGSLWLAGKKNWLYFYVSWGSSKKSLTLIPN